MLLGCFVHGHLDCENFPNPEDRRTRSMRTFQEENIFYTEKMESLQKKFPNEIELITTTWECDFEKTKTSDLDFCKRILPKLKHFPRLRPREAIIGGYRLLKIFKWDYLNDVKTQLLFLDINGCYNYVANSSLFPYGKYKILIGNELNNIEFYSGSLMYKSTKKKLIGGFCKARILPSRDVEPFFPVKLKEQNYNGCCLTCVQKKCSKECTHNDEDRAILVTTTIQALEFALKIENCTIYKLLEIWDFESEGSIFEDYVGAMLQFRETVGQEDIQVSKWLNNSMQVNYGKLAQKPSLDSEQLVDNLQDFENILSSRAEVSNIGKYLLLILQFLAFSFSLLLSHQCQKCEV